METWCDRMMGDWREEIRSISPYHNLKPGMPPIFGEERADAFSRVSGSNRDSCQISARMEIIRFLPAPQIPLL